ncbi:hypothetical protein HY772_03195 [Candidatus Woesearchaeota archaeon]|nr:hypothetical protein [Candidatus Woesearchaeota archaeon]
MTTYIYQGVITYEGRSGQFSEYYMPKEKKKFYATVSLGQKDGHKMIAWQWLPKPFEHGAPATHENGETGGLEQTLISGNQRQKQH